MRLQRSLFGVALFAALALPRPAHALFHLMEIEQVIGGVKGDTTAQAVQLRMRAAGQNLLNGRVRLRAWDATGTIPVSLIDFASNPLVSTACVRILIATPTFESTISPKPAAGAFARDYVMAQIPPGYLAAGSLTFEDMPAFGTKVYWRVSWGGAAYTGTAVGNVTTAAAGGNDADGTMSPPYAGPLPPLLPSTGLDALLFTPNCATAPTNNSLQYLLSTSPAVFTNNAGSSFSVTAPPPPVPTFPGSSGLVLVVALGALAAGAAVLRRRLA